MNRVRTDTFSQTASLALKALISLVLFSNADVRAQTAACEPGTASAFLEANDVRAKIFNSGHLFWDGHPNAYEVPSGAGVQAAFVQMLVLTGRVNGEIRGSVARPRGYEVWPGPVDEVTGLPPEGACAAFDRIYNIEAADLEALDAGVAPVPDLRDWPTGLGAPTLDAEGDLIDITSVPLSERLSRTIDLNAGERPAIIGDQMIWWIMNDVGNEHSITDGPPLGVEIGVSAFAFDESDPLRHTTFYRYRIRYLGTGPLDSLYIGVYQWPEIGLFADDYLGSDSTLGMAYAYNADDLDENHYGPAPPALGLDMVKGPRVGDGSGQQPRAGFTAVVREGIGSSADAYRAEHFENLMRGRWTDGSFVREGGDGRDQPSGARPMPFIYPGEPESRGFWSMMNEDGAGTPGSAYDVRYVAGSGPIHLMPGDVAEADFALVWARGSDHLDSVRELRRADAAVQAFADSGYDRSRPAIDPPAPVATPSDGALTISWSNSSSSNNATESFAVFTPVVGATYAFEGYEVLRFDSATDSVGQVVATFDLDNGVTRVLDVHPDSMFAAVVVDGTDSGILQRSLTVGGLDNYRTYHFGVRSYAFQDGYYPKVIKSAVARVSAEPMPVEENPNMGDAMAAIGIVPNPYYGESEYEVLGGDREVRITNVPEGSVVRVFTLSGSLVRELRQESVGVVRWDLRNQSGRRLTGGTYLVHVEGPTGQRRRVLKFVMVRAR